MANAVGGDITEIRYTHPILGSGVWFIKSGEDVNFDLGGNTNDDDDQSIDSGGRNIRKINRKRWSADGTISWDMNIADELSQAQALSQSPIDADWTFTSINGTVWGATGSPVGDIKGNAQAATFPIKIAGGGTLVKIVG